MTFVLKPYLAIKRQPFLVVLVSEGKNSLCRSADTKSNASKINFTISKPDPTGIQVTATLHDSPLQWLCKKKGLIKQKHYFKKTQERCSFRTINFSYDSKSL